MISTIYTGTYREPEWKELKHWGIKGMKWGIRRYQNEDGTLTPEGKRRYTTKENFTNEQERRSDERVKTLLISAGAAAAGAALSKGSTAGRIKDAAIGGLSTLGLNSAVGAIRRNKRLSKFRDDTFFNEMKKDKKFMKAYESGVLKNYQKPASDMADKLGKKYGYGNPFGFAIPYDEYDSTDPNGRSKNNINNQRYMDALLYQRNSKKKAFGADKNAWGVRQVTTPGYYKTKKR